MIIVIIIIVLIIIIRRTIKILIIITIIIATHDYFKPDEPNEPWSRWVLSLNVSTSLSVCVAIFWKIICVSLQPLLISNTLSEKLKNITATGPL